MKIKILSLIFLGLFLISCQQNGSSKTWYGTSNIGYQYEIPGNFEFCGTETANHFSFTLYCFDEFRAMSGCVSGEPQRKEYSECDFQARIQVNIEPISSFQNSDSILNQTLQRKFPDYNVSYQEFAREISDIVIAEIQPRENSDFTFPIYLTILPHGNNYVAIISGYKSESSNEEKARSAYETFVKSYEPFYGQQ